MATYISPLHRVEILESRTLLNAGYLNLAFGGGDGRMFLSPSAGDLAMAIAAQPDGKFVLAGGASKSGKQVALLERFDAKGKLDPAFGTAGVVKQSISNFSYTRDVVRQSDGKFVIAGGTKTGG